MILQLIVLVFFEAIFSAPQDGILRSLPRQIRVDRCDQILPVLDHVDSMKLAVVDSLDTKSIVVGVRVLQSVDKSLSGYESRRYICGHSVFASTFRGTTIELSDFAESRYGCSEFAKSGDSLVIAFEKSRISFAYRMSDFSSLCKVSIDSLWLMRIQ